MGPKPRLGDGINREGVMNEITELGIALGWAAKSPPVREEFEKIASKQGASPVLMFSVEEICLIFQME